MKIFVSYTLRDAFLSVEDLQFFEVFLSKLGDPYIDILHNQDPDPQEYVMSALKQSEVFYALITPKYFESNWVRLELDIAIQRYIPIIPVIFRQEVNNSSYCSLGEVPTQPNSPNSFLAKQPTLSAQIPSPIHARSPRPSPSSHLLLYRRHLQSTTPTPSR